jgi:hypothetical protein
MLILLSRRPRFLAPLGALLVAAVAVAVVYPEFTRSFMQVARATAHAS